jgi:hypothetical protein
MLKVGDRVYLDGTQDEGTVVHVHPHEVVVRISTATGSEERRFSNESVRIDPTMDEATGFIDQ